MTKELGNQINKQEIANKVNKMFAEQVRIKPLFQWKYEMCAVWEKNPLGYVDSLDEWLVIYRYNENGHRVKEGEICFNKDGTYYVYSTMSGGALANPTFKGFDDFLNVVKYYFC